MIKTEYFNKTDIYFNYNNFSGIATIRKINNMEYIKIGKKSFFI